MKSLYSILFCSFLFVVNAVSAQQNHFIYLQTDNKQPFYIKYEQKILSSSSSGYLIISKLQEGPHTFIVGFPKNEAPEQNITTKVENKDAGYILKNFGEKGWGLFNIQTLEVTMAGAKQTIDAITEPQIPQPKKEIVEEPKAIVSEVKTKQNIRKIETTNKNGGTETIYVDAAGAKTDTVKVFIPMDKEMEKPKEKAKEVMVTNEKFIENKEIVVPVVEKPKVVEPVKVSTNAVTMVNSDCKSVATEDDFLKLRKRMIIEDNDDDMISIARKTFKTKCFTTEQVKNLGALFLKDEGRYKLFDAAYPFVSDTQNFNSLQSQLTTDYYITRFKAMVTH